MDGSDAAVEIPLWIDLLAVFVAGVGAASMWQACSSSLSYRPWAVASSAMS
jgi:hypothetical protein